MQNMDSIKNEICNLLMDIKKDAGEERIGTTEFEIIKLFNQGRKKIDTRLIWFALKKLRQEGKIARSNGYVWIKEWGK